MALFYAAYFDASGRPQQHPFLTVAGAVAPIKKWERFDKQLYALLRSEGEMEFHATDFASKSSKYAKWEKTRRSRFLSNLGTIIKANTNKLFSVSVQIAAWNRVNEEYTLEEFFGTPYAMCGWTVIRQTERWKKRKGIHSPIRYLFEKGDEGWGILRALCRRDKHLEGIEPVDIPKSCARAFQVGDLLAWKARIAATNALRKIDTMPVAEFGDFQSLPESVLEEVRSLDRVLVRPGTTNVYGSEALIRMCEDNRIPKRRSLETPF